MTGPDLASGLDGSKTVGTLVMARESVVVSGHYLASAAGQGILRRGGTAVDAGIAAGLCLSVLLFDQVNYAGVAPMVIHHASTGSLVTIDGLGVWPRRATPELLAARGEASIPPGILRTVTPGAPDAWLTALERYGTMTVGDVFEPAWDLATNGAPISTGVAASLLGYHERLETLAPSTADAFFPAGRLPRAGELFARPELGKVLKSQMDEEARARREGASREEAIRRARDLFYRGWIATAICDFQRSHGGVLDETDLAQYSVSIEPALRTTYRGWEIAGCAPWCQGPVLLQTLNILEAFDLGSFRHNSPEYLHLLVEAMDRAFSDRELYYGDPRFVPVPIGGLLSKEYALARAATIDRTTATGRMPPPGDPWSFQRDSRPSTARFDVLAYVARLAADPGAAPAEIVEFLEPPKIDTSFVASADADGNLFAATPSDPVLLDPVVPALGFPCSGRGSQSRLHAGHPSAVEPGKRPRLTPSPALAMVGGRPAMAFGSSGGDAQPQGMLQVLLNIIDFGMDPQQAVEAPRATTWNFPNSFAPHDYQPGRMDVEGRIERATVDALVAIGHRVGVATDWSPWASLVHAAIRNPASGVLLGASDPREGGSAIGW